MDKQGQNILVLDDDPDIGMMLKMMLEFKGYNSIVVVERAEQAMQAIDNGNIRLIIMDMLLSGTNGTDICMDLKKRPDTKNIPVIMISAHPHAKGMCLNAGADDFIPKPFDIQDILSKINHLINNHQEIRE